MKILLDVNVVLDVLLERNEWVSAAQAIWEASDAGRIECCLAASSATDIYYIIRKMTGHERARALLKICLTSLELLPVTSSTLERAFALDVSDFEDAVQIAVAESQSVDFIVTRDQAGFQNSTVPVLSPAELSLRLQASP